MAPLYDDAGLWNPYTDDPRKVAPSYALTDTGESVSVPAHRLTLIDLDAFDAFPATDRMDNCGKYFYAGVTAVGQIEFYPKYCNEKHCRNCAIGWGAKALRSLMPGNLHDVGLYGPVYAIPATSWNRVRRTLGPRRAVRRIEDDGMVYAFTPTGTAPITRATLGRCLRAYLAAPADVLHFAQRVAFRQPFDPQRGHRVETTTGLRNLPPRPPWWVATLSGSVWEGNQGQFKQRVRDLAIEWHGIPLDEVAESLSPAHVGRLMSWVQQEISDERKAWKNDPDPWSRPP